MKQNPFIYLRVLKHVDMSVFCVADGQKFYWDPQFGVPVPYSSGQQVKRSTMECLTDILNVQPSPVKFCYKINSKGAIKEGEVLSLANPEYVDQLIGGWMRCLSNGEEKTYKRRSPLFISAMTPLHPLLAGVFEEKSITFDRSDRPGNNHVSVKDSDGKDLTDEQINNLLKNDDRSLYRKWITGNNARRATGLFVNNIGIDLRRLFCVSTEKLESEISAETVEHLKDKGWKLIHNVFGECLLMPKEDRDKVIPAIANALIDWHIDSNQARTFSLMETLAVAISSKANKVADSICAKLMEYSEDKQKAKPTINEVDGVDVYITLPGAGYVVTESESADALDKAKQDLIQRMNAFDYENQM